MCRKTRKKQPHVKCDPSDIITPVIVTLDSLTASPGIKGEEDTVPEDWDYFGEGTEGETVLCEDN